MVHLTRKALNRLLEYREGASVGQESVLRLSFNDQRPLLIEGKHQSSDQEFTDGETVLLVISKEIKEFDEAYIDIDELSENEELTIQFWLNGRYTTPQVIAFPE